MTNEEATTTPAQENWTEKKNKLKSQFSTLTDSDLKFEEGKKEEMLARIQAKLGKSKEELSIIIEAL